MSPVFFACESTEVKPHMMNDTEKIKPEIKYNSAAKTIFTKKASILHRFGVTGKSYSCESVHVKIKRACVMHVKRFDI